MPNIKFIKEVEILSSRFDVVYDKKTDAGSFSHSDCRITIGIRCYKKDPIYTLQVISHELMELILAMMGGRFHNSRTNDNYLFNFDHQMFETAIQIHTQTLDKFICYEKPKKYKK